MDSKWIVEETLWSGLLALPYKLVAFLVSLDITFSFPLVTERMGLIIAVMHLYFLCDPFLYICL